MARAKCNKNDITGQNCAKLGHLIQASTTLMNKQGLTLKIMEQVRLSNAIRTRQNQLSKIIKRKEIQ